ncbi:MAG: hypothetical protein RR234_01345 [Christensenella sp.]
MANNITLAQQFVPVLDEVYSSASLTAKLDGSAELARQGANANELIIPKLTMQGLGEYNSNDGYTKGDITLMNETVKCNFDRSRSFSVDSLANQETANIAFGSLAGEFIRTRVVPELDAFRFASYSGKSGISKIAAGAALADGAAVVAALRAATNKMDEDEVPFEDRHLFITPTLHGMVLDLDTNKSKEILTRFASVTLVPQTRFYTAISQKTGKTGEEAGGYTKATAAKNINFMIIHKAAVIQFEKHVEPKLIYARDNQTADAHNFGYRNVGIADAYENKLAGIYLHYGV